MDDDQMEIGESGLIPLKDGWTLIKESGDKISPEGLIYNKDMDVIGRVEYLNEVEDDDG